MATKQTMSIAALKMIADDMQKDAKDFDGRNFNGQVVGEYFGNQGAAIAALCFIVENNITRAIVQDGHIKRLQERNKAIEEQLEGIDTWISEQAE